MPVISSGPYDTAEYVLNLARSIINDASLSISGFVLADSQPYTFPLLNEAYRDLQDALYDTNQSRFTRTTQLLLVTPVMPLDPGITVYINFTNYWNGSQSFNSPILPSDMMEPLKLWERQSYTTNYFSPMFQVNDGLPSISQTPALRYWDWENDNLIMPGATQTNDLQLKYACYLADLIDGTSPVQILRGAVACAHFLAGEFAASRGSPLADAMFAKANEKVEQMTNRTVKRSNRGNHRRQPYSRRGGNVGWSTW